VAQCIGVKDKKDHAKENKFYVEDDKKSGGLKSYWILRHFTLLCANQLRPSPCS
jgi:hypothetical protein